MTLLLACRYERMPDLLRDDGWSARTSTPRAGPRGSTNAASGAADGSLEADSDSQSWRR
jgi:hypothetical protein